MADLDELAKEFDPKHQPGSGSEMEPGWATRFVQQLSPVHDALKGVAQNQDFQVFSMMILPAVAGTLTRSKGVADAVRSAEKELPMPAIFRSAEELSHHGGPGVKIYPLEAFTNREIAAKFVPPDVAGPNPRAAIVFGGGGNSMYAHAGVTDFLESKGLMDANSRTIGISAGSTHTALHMAGVPLNERLALMNETFDIKRQGDVLELLWQFHPLRSKVGNGITDGLPRTGIWPFGIWDGKPLDTLPQWQKLVDKLDLQRRIDRNHSFVAYDPWQKAVVEFRGGPGEYDVAKALAASTAFNMEGMGIKPVETMIHGRKYNLIDFGLLQNHPTRPLIAENKPAIISSLYQRGNNREQDTIIHALKENRLPFDRVNDSDVQRMFRDGYDAAEQALAPRIETPTAGKPLLIRSLIKPLMPVAGW